MRYKVHAPHCDCPRVVGLRARYRDEAKEEGGKKEEERREATAADDDDDDNVGGGGMTSTGGRHGNGDVCDSFDRMNLTTATATTTNASNDAITSRASDEEDGTTVDMTIFDNLLVLPDTKANPPYGAYACLGTNRRAFATNRIVCERRLAHEIFDANVDDIDGTRRFKVSCARCLLSDHMPNGFVAITSNSHDDLMRVLRIARDAACERWARASRPLHADHAHFVCAVDTSSLTSLLPLLDNGRTRTRSEETNRIAMDIARGIAMDDGCARYLPHDLLERMPPSYADDRDERRRPSSSRPPIPRGSDDEALRIELGHHLSSLLHMLVDENIPGGEGEDRRRSRANDATTTTPRHDVTMMGYLMVMGYVVIGDGNDDGILLTLDLPGGKRHLGESTLSCAIRETEEECSLIIDEMWLSDMVHVRYGGNVEEEGGEEGGEEEGSTSMTNDVDELRRSVTEDDGAFVRVLTSRVGNDSHDAFIVMTPPPSSSTTPLPP